MLRGIEPGLIESRPFLAEARNGSPIDVVR